MRNEIIHNIINAVCVQRRFFLLRKWTKVRPNFFLFDSDFDSKRASGIMFKRRLPVKKG
jgi:hypothetical protein